MYAPWNNHKYGWAFMLTEVRQEKTKNNVNGSNHF